MEENEDGLAAIRIRWCFLSAVQTIELLLNQLCELGETLFGVLAARFAYPPQGLVLAGARSW
jgi:hypothetical protein